MKYKALEIFSPGVFPKYTYHERNNSDLEQKLRSALEVSGILVSLSGPSKSGKTVLVERIVSKENLINVTGTGIRSTEDLWRKVLKWMGEPDEQASTKSTTIGGGITGGGKASFNALIAGGEASGSVTGNISRTFGTTKTIKRPTLETIVSEIGGSDYVILIDDFHYIDKETQPIIAQELKEAIRNQVKVITASIPFRGDDVIRANPDLRGRVNSIDLEYWKPNELIEIAKKGLPLMGLSLNSAILDRFAAEAAGSPQLFQHIMLSLCLETDKKETQNPAITLTIDDSTYQKIMQRTALSADYSTILGKLLEGPKTRGTERKIYKFKDASEGDVYAALSKAIVGNPPSLFFNYQELQNRIDNVCQGDKPSGSSVTGACYQIAEIAEEIAKDRIIEWEAEKDYLHIRDPYLLFYLRWSGKV